MTVERRKIVVEGHLADGSALTIFAVPVEKGFYRGLEYSAIAVGYNSNDLKETLNIEAFHEQSEYYVVCPDGRILFATKNEEIQGGNLLKDLKNNARMIDYSVEQVISDFAEPSARCPSTTIFLRSTVTASSWEPKSIMPSCPRKER